MRSIWNSIQSSRILMAVFVFVVVAAVLMIYSVVKSYFGVSPLSVGSNAIQIIVLGVVPLAIAYFNQNLSSHFRKVTTENQSMRDTLLNQISTVTLGLGSVRSDVSNVRADVSDIKLTVGRLVALKDTKAAQKRSLLNLQNFCISFMAFDTELRRYATLKAISFREFVDEVHDMDLFCNCQEAIVRSGIDRADQLRRVGYDILGKDFIDFFYESHSKATSLYFSEICRIFTDPDNSKHERFQEKSEEFMKAFLSNLHTSYINYKKKTA